VDVKRPLLPVGWMMAPLPSMILLAGTRIPEEIAYVLKR
jgi:hypothetical protein